MGNQITGPATAQAQQWNGWGTALKPAHEPIVVARKPLTGKTVCENLIKWGTGGINIDKGRISPNGGLVCQTNNQFAPSGSTGHFHLPEEYHHGTLGRFPANLIHNGTAARFFKVCPWSENDLFPLFYCAKASKSERNRGCNCLNDKYFNMRPFAGENCDLSVLKNRMNSKHGKNNHPNV